MIEYKKGHWIINGEYYENDDFLVAGILDKLGIVAEDDVKKEDIEELKRALSAILINIAQSNNEGNTILQDIYDKIYEVGDSSLSELKDILQNIYDKISDGGSEEEIERVKRELLFLIHLLDVKIEKSKLIAGRGIIIEGNVISTTNGSYIDKLIEDYEKLLNEYKKLKKQYDDLVGELAVCRSKNEKLFKDNERLKNDLREETKKYDAAISTVAKLEKEVKRLEEIIAKGEDYKLYKKYEKLYHEAEKEAAKWRKEYEDCSGITRSNWRMTHVEYLPQPKIGSKCYC